MKRADAADGPYAAKWKAGRKPIGIHSDDPTTLSEPNGPGRARQRHLSFDLAVDFTTRQLRGSVTVTAVRGPAGEESGELVLDTRGQEISKITIGGFPCKFVLGDERDHLGRPLHITIPGGAEGSEAQVCIEYATQPPQPSGEGGCSALQFLSASQTQDKKLPYLFSQCQFIHARSLVPCQDTCEAKVTYDARIACPAELTPLMSAVRSDVPEELSEPPQSAATPDGCAGKWNAWRFTQTVPVPTYLIAIVCGGISSRRIGPRSHVWCEPSMLDACQHEFSDHTEKFIQAGEELCGPYEWGVYDLLVLPPSFPYGGMENPCLTFVTPSLIAGDRSQVGVVAHEISHSWSGNLVTNHTWEHFWLNEGLTVFTEMKIVEAVLGLEEAALAKQVRWSTLEPDVRHFGEEHPFTCLMPDLSGGIDPDDAFSTVPYAKGSACLEYLQTQAGGRQVFEPFIRAYIKKFRHQTVTTVEFRAEYEGAFPEVAKSIDWDQLFYAPGMPPHTMHIDQGPLLEAERLAEAWSAADASGGDCSQLPSIDGWPSGKVCAFLDCLMAREQPLKAATAAALCTRYQFFKANAEIRYRSICIAFRAGWDGAVAACEDMAYVGRMKFARPLYKALKDFDYPRAVALFEKHRAGYHPITAKMVQRDLDEQRAAS
eukprot:TRINITY_DN20701_c0_g1_i1.p1 TRINITY_DN20701_c0_g1~~TRINITY_DN20701_c0_g1_i1.p1  ORF type:complete len:656 (+),score=170.93 TRINITY_DN20701_c0_g1_i1:78-2045(+)